MNTGHCDQYMFIVWPKQQSSTEARQRGGALLAMTSKNGFGLYLLLCCSAKATSGVDLCEDQADLHSAFNVN